MGSTACGAANVRPYLTPFPEAPVDTLRGDPEVVVREIERLLAEEGIPIRVASAEEGYVESTWYEAGVAPDAPRLASRVRYRFWVDPIGQRLTRVIGEAAAEFTVDPSLPPREREVMVPRSHPGYGPLERIRDAVRQRFPQP